MDSKLLIALISKIVDESLDRSISTKRVRGISGRDGVDGKSFSFEDEKEKISNIISDYVDSIKDSLKLKFEDLSSEELAQITGKNGNGFIFSENVEKIEAIIVGHIDSIKDSLKLKFEDLSIEDLAQITGKDGVDGKSFSFDENKESINSLIKSYIDEKSNDLKLKFSDLTSEELAQITGKDGQKGARGIRGQKGKDGKDFSFEENKDAISGIILENRDSLKLKFADLTEEEVLSITGKDGKDGNDGKNGLDGESFDFEKEKENISSLVLENKEHLKLKLSDLTKDEIEEIRGPKGARGQKGKNGFDGKDGKDFSFEENKESISGLILENRDSLKLNFSDLTNEERESIRGEKGPKGARGQKGRDGESFDFEKEKEKISSLVVENKDSLKLKFSDLTEEERNSIRGARGAIGVAGLNGKNGINGKDGKDAPVIVDVEIVVNNDNFEMVFYFSNGSKIVTNEVAMPVIKNIYNNYYSASSGGKGGASSQVAIKKDDTELGVAESINFLGDNITVDYNATTKEASVSVVAQDVDACLEIYDEGVIASDCAKRINFVGDNVEIIQSTTMSDWSNLSDIDSIGLWESANPQFVTVKINAPQKFTIKKIASDNVSALDLISLDSQTTAKRGAVDTYSNATISGIALASANAGQEFEILVFGVLDSNLFNFTVNAPLFLGSNGRVTDVPTSTIGEYRTKIGKSYGDGSIFIDVQETKQYV